MNIASIGITGNLAGIAPDAATNRGTSSETPVPIQSSPIQDLPKTAPASQEEVKDSVKALNELVTSLNSDLQFSIDKDTGKTVVKLIDPATDEVIKQIPSEEILAVAKAIDQLKGVFIKQQA